MRRLLHGLALGTAAVACPVVAYGGELVTGTDPNTGAITIEGGIDYWTSYYFRGYLQEDSGLILQPYATLNFALNDSASLYVGTWNSLHEEETMADPGSTGAWYESDFIVGLDMTFGKVGVGVIYTAYTYPNGAFDTIEELGAAVSYDDTGMWGQDGFALRPYVGVYFETDDDNGTEDTYAEIGIGPTVYTDEGSGLSVGVPVAIGLGLEDYYFDDDGDDELLGYARVGVTAALPLPVPSEYGEWAVTAGVYYLHLFADGVEAVNDGDDSEFQGSVGISFAY